MRQLLKSAVRKVRERVVAPRLQTVRQREDDRRPPFARTPCDRTIRLLRTLLAPEQISIGDGNWLDPGSLFLPLRHFPSPALWSSRMPRTLEQTFESRIVIGNRVTASATDLGGPRLANR